MAQLIQPLRVIQLRRSFRRGLVCFHRAGALMPRRDSRTRAGRDRDRDRRDGRDVAGRCPDFLADRADWGPVMILQEDT